MVSMSPKPSGFTVVDVRDPAEMDERSLMSRRLPGRHGVHTYTLRDPALRRSSGAGRLLLARHTDLGAGDLLFGHVAERFGIEVGILEPGLPNYCFSLIRSGRCAMSTPDTRGTTEAGPGGGLIHLGRAGTRALTADGTARTNVWIAAGRLEAALEACLGERLRAPLVFEPGLDWASGAGAALCRLVLHLTQELPRPDGLAANSPALAAFADLFVHTALRGLPHSHAERLARQRDGAAPTCVRRAEAYFRDHADQAVRLEDAAAAAGCSARALQRAFRRFRDTSPHAALHHVRLELARAELARGEAAAAAVARRYGFTNAGRFAAAYASRFGELPSETRRRSAARPAAASPVT
jgi:AraC-like DNA-binding protein